MNGSPKKKIPWFWIIVFCSMFGDALPGLIGLAITGWVVYSIINAVKKPNSQQQTNYAQYKTTQTTTQQTSAKTSAAGKSGSYNAQPSKQKPVSSMADAGQKQTVKSVLWIIAGVFALIVALVVASELQYGFYLSDALTAGGFGLAGCIGLYTGIRKRKRAKMQRRYAAIIGNREWMALEEIAQALPTTEYQCEKELQALIDEGYYGPAAFIDSTRGVFYRSSDVAQVHESSRVKKGPSVSKPVDLDNHEEVIKEIRRLNDEIADPDVSARIDKIEQLTDSIYKLIDKYPEKRSQVTTFMDYYLPTTLKLLSAYGTFEDQAASGENIKSAKANIESILDTLVSGFSQQLDRLFETDAMDISGDIQVLEQMMERDGLTIGKGNIKSVKKGLQATSGGSATAVATAPEDESIVLTLGDKK